jgi:hypothetical protein
VTPLPPVRPLTEAARRAGSIRATGGFSGAAKRWQERAVTGMSDAALAEALAGELGIFGGSGGPAALTLRCLCYSSRWLPNPPLLSPAINPNGSQAASEKK